MAVPSSGTLSLRSIRNEIYHDAYGSIPAGVADVSLGALSTGSGGNYPINTNSASFPNAAKPFAMSEFYGYDHDAAAAFAETHPQFITNTYHRIGRSIEDHKQNLST